MLFELPTEVAFVIKAGHITDLVDGIEIGQEQFSGILQFQILYVSVGGGIVFLLKQLPEVDFAHAAAGGQVGDGNGFRQVVAVDEVDGRLDGTGALSGEDFPLFILHFIDDAVKLGFDQKLVGWRPVVPYLVRAFEVVEIIMGIFQRHKKWFKMCIAMQLEIDGIAICSCLLRNGIGGTLWEIDDCISVDGEFLMLESIGVFSTEKDGESMAGTVGMY